MSGYSIHDAGVIIATVAVLAMVVAFGRVFERFALLYAARLAAWALVIGAVAYVERLTTDEPSGVRMLAIIAVLLLAMKAVVIVKARRLGSPILPLGWWLGFVLLWPGMRPGPFCHPALASLPGAGGVAANGVLRMIIGASLITLARLVWIWTGSRYLATVPLLLGISLIVHFGLFDLLAGAWRWAVVDCKPLFRSPLRSTSLGEFWGRRWNLAFSVMATLAIYQPLVRRAGRRVALGASFLGSGVLHELAISVPVRAGYGLPMSDFALHGILVMLEGHWARSGRPADARPWIGRAWTCAWVIVPLPILFHRPFLAGVVWPLIGIES
jgi:alginate O-acetyltransferase complex protein AlgI